MSVEDDLRAAAAECRIFHGACNPEDCETTALAARLEALVDRRAQEEAVIAAALGCFDGDYMRISGTGAPELREAVFAYLRELLT